MEMEGIHFEILDASVQVGNEYMWMGEYLNNVDKTIVEVR